MIQLTQRAVDAVRKAMSGSAAEVAGVRIMVEAGGCAGLRYTMGLVAEADPDDFPIESGDVRIFVERDSQGLLDGTTIDFVSNLEGAGFQFDNPNAKNLCSCGKSFG
jgi:iron-sulfur cluster assembly protein